MYKSVHIRACLAGEAEGWSSQVGRPGSSMLEHGHQGSATLRLLPSGHSRPPGQLRLRVVYDLRADQDSSGAAQ